ncbi:hypothetical protein V1525DRAFT_392457 [Lipomyces kononenkoae]|uniref:Uncharacterized protein n=1 Tax=Lipomyces kononenkoae TaxID=34357 RepID=A0ACC3TCQ2_LIPKO
MMSHLRRAWKKRFPEVDETDSPEGDIVYLDEQQQDELIISLREENESLNLQYRIAFTIITLIQTPIFLFHPVLKHQGKYMLTILAFTSLLVTAFVMHTTPISRSALAGTIAAEAANTDLFAAAADPASLSLIRRFGFTNSQIIILLNAVLGALIAGIAYMKFSPLTGIDYVWFSPLGSICAVVLVRGWMREGDVDSLEQFRYKYKGA